MDDIFLCDFALLLGPGVYTGDEIPVELEEYLCELASCPESCTGCEITEVTITDLGNGFKMSWHGKCIACPPFGDILFNGDTVVCINVSVSGSGSPKTFSSVTEP
jgi:hypothetical protein